MNIKYGYKKASGVVVKLELLEDSIVYHCGTKYRTNKARVIGFYSNDYEKLDNIYCVGSDWDENFLYKINRISEVHDFDTNDHLCWGNGIHFFETFEEAANYTSNSTLFCL